MENTVCFPVYLGLYIYSSWNTPRTIINIKGKVDYSESGQAWNKIKLKTEFLNEFHQLKEKRSKFSYEMVFGRTEEEMIGLLKKAISKGKMLPVLMFLYREG